MIINQYKNTTTFMLSVFASVGIFFLMQSLITSDLLNKRKDNDISYLEFIRVNQDDSLQERDRRIPDRPKPEKRPPPPPDIELQQEETLVRPNIDIELPMFNIPTDFSGAFLGNLENLGGSSSALIPMVKVQAKCPIQAISGGINGTVEIFLVVNPGGKVEKARVTRASNGNIFNKEAIKAIRRWQFKPKIINGIPVEQAGQIEMEFICNA